jgi:hypothetical protein
MKTVNYHIIASSLQSLFFLLQKVCKYFKSNMKPGFAEI